MTPDHTKAKEMAKFIAGGYDSGYERDLADAYLDLTAKVELMEAALSFYAAPMEFTHSLDGWIKVRRFGTGDAFVNYFEPAREVLAKYKEGLKDEKTKAC